MADWPKSHPVKRNLLGGFVLLIVLNFLVMLGRLSLPDSLGDKAMKIESPDDELPRDGVQLIAALASGKDYNEGAVRGVQIAMYLFGGIVLLAVVGACSSSTESCANVAFKKFPEGALVGLSEMRSPWLRVFDESIQKFWNQWYGKPIIVGLVVGVFALIIRSSTRTPTPTPTLEESEAESKA